MLEDELLVSWGIKYVVDLIICIDVIGLMILVIDLVKLNVFGFYKEIENRMKER